MNRFPVRPGMDVYSAYQDEYIGSVVRVVPESAPAAEGSPETGSSPTGSSGPSAARVGPPVAGETEPDGIGPVHEEGAVIGHIEAQGSEMLGEEMGPVPTIASGNTGPVTQSARHAYATGGEPAQDIRWLVVRPGRINLGPLTPPLYVPADAIRSISMERIVLNVQRRSIPAEWCRKP
jgi:hypothetical protein